MTILPRTLAGRTILALLAGLVISNLVGLLIYAGERNTVLSRVTDVTSAERIAAVVLAVERTPPGATGVLCGQSGPGFIVTLAAQAAVTPGDGGLRSRPFLSAISNLLDNPKPGRLRVTNSGSGGDPSIRQSLAGSVQKCMGQMMHMMPGMMAKTNMSGMPMSSSMARMMPSWQRGEILQVSYQLDDHRWLNVSTLAPRVGSIWRSRFFLAFFVMAVIVTLLSVWAVRRSTAPLALFAWAAERLGQDVNAPDLPEAGPREVNRAAKAFNEMQRRLRGLINDRTQMLAAMSHDLRTPITRLRLRAEFVEDAEQRGKMLNDLAQMEAMIAVTLAFAREDSADEPRKTVDLAALVESVCDDATDSGYDVVYTGASRALYNGRPLALKRVFANLVDNAVKYGGKARIALQMTPENITVTIDDDGPGIPENERERVFEPFYRLESSRNRETGGTGLGLAVVRSIVRSHGGDVTLANLPHGGLIATVILENGGA